MQGSLSAPPGPGLGSVVPGDRVVAEAIAGRAAAGRGKRSPAGSAPDDCLPSKGITPGIAVALLRLGELGLLAGEIGRVHRARGELARAVEIETDLHGELEQIRARINADRPEREPVELDAETEAARRAREPLGPATREAPDPVDDVEAVKRLIDPTRRRRPRQR